MKKYLLMGAGLAALTGGVALAQQAAPPPPAPPGAEAPPPHRPEPGGWDRGGPRESGGHGRFMRMMMRNNGGAHFHISRGDAVIDVRCSANEPMKACVDAASALLDKAGAR